MIQHVECPHVTSVQQLTHKLEMAGYCECGGSQMDGIWGEKNWMKANYGTVEKMPDMSMAWASLYIGR